MKKIIVSFFLISLIILSYGQNKTNQYDTRGRKNGLWIEDYPSSHWEKRYKNGKLHGVFVAYEKKFNKISVVGEYFNGKPTGTWYFFNDNGISFYKVHNFLDNDTIVIGDDKYLIRYKPVYQATMVNYYPSGCRKSEGLILFDEDPQLESYKYGIWFYYNEDGTIKEKRMFKP